MKTHDSEGATPGTLHSILVVDDDEAIREAVSCALEDEGYEVEVACNGREAIDVLHHARLPCVVLLDLMMPVMNGWEVASAMHDDRALAGIPIIVTSGMADRSPKGVARVLAKPVDLDTLLAAVSECCGWPPPERATT